MPTSIHSLPPELLLQILEAVARAPVDQEGGLAPTRRSPKPEPNPLLATSLVSHRFRRLSQQLRFHSVKLSTRAQARLWRETSAGVHTKEMTLSLGIEPPAVEPPWVANTLPLAELFALSSAHAATGREVRLMRLHIVTIGRSELEGQLSGVGALEGQSRATVGGGHAHQTIH